MVEVGTCATVQVADGRSVGKTVCLACGRREPMRSINAPMTVSTNKDARIRAVLPRDISAPLSLNRPSRESDVAGGA